MKKSGWFFAVLLFSTGLLVLFFRFWPERYRSDLFAQTGTLNVQKFARKTFANLNSEKPPKKISLSTLIKARKSSELLKPELWLPHTHLYAANEIHAVQIYAETCKESLLPKKIAKDLSKTLVWHRFLCGETADLSENFFARPPYLHPSGASFVALAREIQFADEEWYQKHQGYLSLPEALKVSGEVSSIYPGELSALVNQEDLVLTDSYVFLNDKTPDLPNYLVFSSKALFEQLKSEPFLLKKASLDECLFFQGNACWVRNPDYLPVQAWLLTGFLGLVSIVSLTALSASFVRYQRERKLLERRRQFVLQMLTHELRTPVTGLQLRLENMRKGFDQLPTESQKDFLHLCEEVSRLSSLTEASRHYLQSQDDHPDTQQVFLKPLLEDLIAEFESPIEFQFNFTDEPLELPVYWLKLSVRNLIANAIHHGKSPISLSVEETSDGLAISVSDHGRLELAELPALTEPFFKSKQSQGLGLGLTIVQTVLPLLNAELKVKNQPSTFTILIKGKT